MIGVQSAVPERGMPPAGAAPAALRRILAHAGIWSAGSQALSSGMSLLVSIAAARLLGIEAFGQYVLIITGTIVAASLQYQLVSGPMMIVSGQRNRSASYYGTVARAIVLVAVLGGLAVAAYVLALFGWSSGSLRPDLALGGFLVAAGHVMQDGAKRILFARGRPRLAFLCEVSRHAVFVLAILACWLSVGASVLTLLICTGLALVLTSLPVLAPMLWLPARRHLRSVVIARHWHLGRWLMLMVLVSMVYDHLVTIVAGASLGDEAAAALRAAQLLFGPLLVLLSSLENFVPRRAAEHLRAGGRPALAAYLRRVFLVMEIPVLAVCAAVILFGAPILGFLMGPAFEAFAPLAVIIALIPPITLARDMAITYLRTVERTRGIFLAFAASAAVTALAVIPLIQIWGVTGAAATLVLGQGTSTILVLISASRR